MLGSAIPFQILPWKEYECSVSPCIFQKNLIFLTFLVQIFKFFALLNVGIKPTKFFDGKKMQIFIENKQNIVKLKKNFRPAPQVQRFVIEDIY